MKIKTENKRVTANSIFFKMLTEAPNGAIFYVEGDGDSQHTAKHVFNKRNDRKLNFKIEKGMFLQEDEKAVRMSKITILQNE